MVSLNVLNVKNILTLNKTARLILPAEYEYDKKDYPKWKYCS